ncbi:MAG: hypothetical protein ACXACY_28775 [Candidatus Hodarchaeales archaeon]
MDSTYTQRICPECGVWTYHRELEEGIFKCVLCEEEHLEDGA